jgi:hypothetical protein
MNAPLFTRAKVCLLAAGLVFSPLAVHQSFAGSAVASDGHGGYGFCYGHNTKGDLENSARNRCQHITQHHECVKIIAVSTCSGGCAIVRYYMPNGHQYISAYVGMSSVKKARSAAIAYAINHGAESYKVVEEWCD